MHEDAPGARLIDFQQRGLMGGMTVIAPPSGLNAVGARGIESDGSRKSTPFTTIWPFGPMAAVARMQSTRGYAAAVR